MLSGGDEQLGLDIDEDDEGNPTVYIDVMHEQTGGARR
jgi:hypothetical protein